MCSRLRLLHRPHHTRRRLPGVTRGEEGEGGEEGEEGGESIHTYIQCSDLCTLPLVIVMAKNDTEAYQLTRTLTLTLNVILTYLTLSSSSR